MGVTFVDTALQVHPSTSLQDFIFKVTLPGSVIPPPLPVLDLCSKLAWNYTLVGYSHFFSITERCKVIQSDVNMRIDSYNNRLGLVTNLTSNLKLMTGQLAMSKWDRQKTPRHKKAALGFVGSWVAGIFGLATSGDVQSVIEHVRDLKSTAKDVISDLHQTRKFMARVVESTNKRFNKSWGAIVQIQTEVEKLYGYARDLNRRASLEATFATMSFTILSALLDVVLRIVSMAEDLMEYHALLRDWQNSMLLLTENKLPPLLVEPGLLIEELNRFSHSPEVIDRGLRVLHMNAILYYYSHRLATAVVDGETMYIHIKVPLGSREANLKILYAET